jgi:Uma2 family endonuclease
MSVSRRWTVKELEQITPVEGYRYEVLDGELHVSKQPTWHHQFACGELHVVLGAWNHSERLGAVMEAPGLVFDAESAAAPDLVWISWSRLRSGEDRSGHLTIAPELVIEVLSSGSSNERRDREPKLAVYAREGVEEYWILDWRHRSIQVYRRFDDALEHVQTLTGDAVLESPLLPGFRVALSRLWPPTR